MLRIGIRMLLLLVMAEAGTEEAAVTRCGTGQYQLASPSTSSILRPTSLHQRNLGLKQKVPD